MLSENLSSVSDAIRDTTYTLGASYDALALKSQIVTNNIPSTKSNKIAPDILVKQNTQTLQDSQFNFLTPFLKGASAAQKAQISMIRKVFELMDVDSDGLISFSDAKSYFRSVGRYTNDTYVRNWINERDIDQDGALSLVEFISSYSNQLDPKSLYVDYDGNLSESNSPASSLAIAFGSLCLSNTITECKIACNAVEAIILKIIDSPQVKSYWRILINESDFYKKIGRLKGGIKLMEAFDFQVESNGSILAIKNDSGKEWSNLPKEVRSKLRSKLIELRSHAASLEEPSISNIAAGLIL